MAGEARPSQAPPFGRIVCGIDGSEESVEAARQAVRLLDPGGALVLVAAVEPWGVVLGQQGETLEATRDARRAELQEALDGVRETVGADVEVDSQLLERDPVQALQEEAERAEAGTIAVGAPTRARVKGIALGAVSTGVLHKAPQAVLLARSPGGGRLFPERVVAGIDGSQNAMEALAVAEGLAGRLGCELHKVAAQGGKGLDADVVARAGIEEVAGSPVPALVEACGEGDLLVVGSRGLHGLRALGSVSERVAHQAPCSVLVVRAGAVLETAALDRVKVRDVMVAPAVVVRADATLGEAAQTMLAHRIGGLPVVDENGELVGILTESDFAGEESQLESSRYGYSLKLPKVFGRWLLPDQLERLHEQGKTMRVAEAMSTPVVTATEDEPLQAAVERMVHHDVNRVPVVSGRRVVGIVSRHDLLRLMASVER